MSRQTDSLMERVSITAETQADRVLNLLEMLERESGKPLKFQDIADRLASSGIKLGRSSWHAIQDPEYRYSRVQPLTAIALFFGEHSDFLIKEEVEPSERYKENLEEIINEASMNTAQTYFRHARRFSNDVFVNKVFSNFVDIIQEERKISRDELIATI